MAQTCRIGTAVKRSWSSGSSPCKTRFVPEPAGSAAGGRSSRDSGAGLLLSLLLLSVGGFSKVLFCGLSWAGTFGSGVGSSLFGSAPVPFCGRAPAGGVAY